MKKQMQSHPARWWEKAEKKNYVRCRLCPRFCCFAPGETGFCGVRKNIDGELFSTSYGHPVALNIDPIEKKPLAEFLPGSNTFSIGTFGCNLNCCFCQNDSLSRGSYCHAEFQDYRSPQNIVDLALQYDCQSIAFTYNEPTVFAEYVIDICDLAHRNNLKTVLVSNGYITLEAANDLYPHIDAANIDMKGFSENFYSTMTGASLQPVLDAIKYFYKLGKHLELTNLIIPGHNDSDEMIIKYLTWVEQNLGRNTTLYFSAFHPAYKLNKIKPTNSETLFHIRYMALKQGFESIHLGNI